VHRDRYSDRQPWLLIRVKPATEAAFRRGNLILICCLTFVVLSVFAMGLTPQISHAYVVAHKVPLKIDRNPPR
jgi:hypothetical protein